MQDQAFAATVTAVKGRAFIVLPFDPDEIWETRARRIAEMMHMLHREAQDQGRKP